jgi:hypothetical protein
VFPHGRGKLPNGAELIVVEKRPALVAFSITFQNGAYQMEAESARSRRSRCRDDE